MWELSAVRSLKWGAGLQIQSRTWDKTTQSVCVGYTGTGLDWTKINSLSTTRHAGDIAESTMCCCHFSLLYIIWIPLYLYTYIYILNTKCGFKYSYKFFGYFHTI